MSWRQEYEIKFVEPIKEVAPTIDSVLGEPTFDSTSKGTDNFENEQITLARKVAREIVLSGFCGIAPLKVELQGHSNPEHKPRGGWAGDAITVTVRNVT